MAKSLSHLEVAHEVIDLPAFSWAIDQASHKLEAKGASGIFESDSYRHIAYQSRFLISK